MKTGKIYSRAVVLICGVLAITPLLVAGCASNNIKTSLTNRILISDNVDLDTGDRQAILNMEPPPGSINEYGYYLSPRFFLSSKDTIQVVITGNAPVSLSGGSQNISGSLQTGLNSIGEEDEPTTNIDLSYFTVTTLTGSNNIWELVYLFPSKRVPENYYQIPSGYYQLNIYNDSGNPAQCSYTITLLAG